MSKVYNESKWTDLSPNPVSDEVFGFLRQKLRQLSVRPMIGYRGLLLDFCLKKRVLDIGCVEHDASHYNLPSWKHAWIKEVASELLGIDILEKGVSELVGRGYNMKVADATSDFDLGERWDVVVVGDVIEHVDNAVALMKFSERHLAESGSVLVRTPNPFYFKYFLETLMRGSFVANAEHLNWMTPTNALEIARRSGLTLVRYYPMIEVSWKTRWAMKMLEGLSRQPPEVFAWSYLYVFTKSKKKDNICTKLL